MKPSDIAETLLFDPLSVEENVPAENRKLVAQPRELTHELYEGVVLLAEGPIDPIRRVVLAVAVVVAVLGARELVSSGHHRRPLREQQSRQHVPDLPLPQRLDRRIVAGPFYAAIPGAIVRRAILVAIAVCFVVPLVVSNGIVQREPIVRGDQVDTGPGSAALMLEQRRG